MDPVGAASLNSLWVDGTFGYAMVVVVANMKIFVSVSNHDPISTFWIFGSIGMFFLTFFVESLIPFFEIYGCFPHLMKSSEFWFTFLLCCFACVLVDIGLKYVRKMIMSFIDKKEAEVVNHEIRKRQTMREQVEEDSKDFTRKRTTLRRKISINMLDTGYAFS
jgi:predicted membrane protein